MTATEAPAPHCLDLADGWCSTHDAYCDVDFEAEEYFSDPVDEPMVWDGVLHIGEQSCGSLITVDGETGMCWMPVGRIGDWWVHSRQGVPPGGHHQARPVVT